MKEILSIFCCLLMASVAHGELVLLGDDFSSGNVSNQTRYGDEDLGLWLARDAGWSIGGGTLTNDLANANSERAVIKLFDVTATNTSLTAIRVSFDYTVPADATLYFYANGYEGPLGTGLQSRLTRTDGRYFTASSDDFNSNLGTGYNLLNGASPTGETPSALTSLSNTSGTFNQIYDISAFAGVSDITDFDFMNVIFAVDETAAGGSIIIDNFRLTAIPEPTTFCMFGLGLSTLLTRRRQNA